VAAIGVKAKDGVVLVVQKKMPVSWITQQYQTIFNAKLMEIPSLMIFLMSNQ